MQARPNAASEDACLGVAVTYEVFKTAIESASSTSLGLRSALGSVLVQDRDRLRNIHDEMTEPMPILASK